MLVLLRVSAAVTVANDVVFAPGLDGKVRAFKTANGELLWQFETAREFQTTSGTSAHGGSMDSAGVQFAADMVYMQSGYGLFGQLPGNLLLAFHLSEDSRGTTGVHEIREARAPRLDR